MFSGITTEIIYYYKGTYRNSAYENALKVI